MNNFTENEITYALTVNVSDFTPWILKRIKFCLNFYNSQNRTLFLELGSEESFSNFSL